MMTSFEVQDELAEDLPLLRMLPRLVGANAASPPTDMLLVDGTTVIPSTFYLSEENSQWVSAGNAAAADGEDLYIGRLDLSLRLDDDDSNGHTETATARIAAAPWPPEYVLETVAAKTGVVLVNNVNCGYLDIAMNLLRSIRNVSDAEVRHMYDMTQTCSTNF